MATSANAVWEARTTATASNVNGGFFITGASGTDFSQQDSAAYNLTSVTSAGAGNTVLTASAAADMVGNGAYVVSGTNFTSGATAGRFEIVSVVVGVSITFATNTAGASITTGVGAAGVINIGGALSLGSADDSVFEAMEPGNIMYVAAGAYTIGGTVSITKAGGTQNPINVIGYTTSRGDNPNILTDMPRFDLGINPWNSQNNWDYTSIAFMSTNANMFATASSGKFRYCKFKNTSTTAGRIALTTGSGTLYTNCEFVSYRGTAVSLAGTASFLGCHIHSSNIGLNGASTANAQELINCIIEGCVTYNVGTSVAATGKTFLYGCTIYGAANTTGIGVSLATGTTNYRIISCIISGFVTGVSHADVQKVGFDDFNAYYNNDTDVTNWTKGSNDISTNPTFVDVTQVTGATATTSGSVLTQAGADFTASGVVAGRDYLYLVSGTGITAGIYGITAVGTTTLTLDIAPGTNATADKVFQLNVGKNFAVGAPMADFGFPEDIIEGYTTTHVDVGAVQRLEDYPSVSDVRDTVVYANGDMTGSLDLPVEADVRFGVDYDGGSKTGLLDLPAEADVLDGVFYDNGTKEGTLVSGGGGGDIANYQELPQVSTTGNIANYSYVD